MKLCTCDGAGRGPGRQCVVKQGGRLGDLWVCREDHERLGNQQLCGQCGHREACEQMGCKATPNVRAEAPGVAQEKQR
jgi:hypothetical protein